MEFIKKIWKKIDGNKTYISASSMLLLVLIKSIFPNFIPDGTYSEIKQILEILLYGSATHGVYKRSSELYNKQINKNKNEEL